MPLKKSRQRQSFNEFTNRSPESGRRGRVHNFNGEIIHEARRALKLGKETLPIIIKAAFSLKGPIRCFYWYWVNEEGIASIMAEMGSPFVWAMVARLCSFDDLAPAGSTASIVYEHNLEYRIHLDAAVHGITMHDALAVSPNSCSCSCQGGTCRKCIQGPSWRSSLILYHDRCSDVWDAAQKYPWVSQTKGLYVWPGKISSGDLQQWPGWSRKLCTGITQHVPQLVSVACYKSWS